MTSVQTSALGIALVGTLLVAPSLGARSTAQTAVQPVASSSLLGNGGFTNGSGGWGVVKPRQNALIVSRAGIDRSAGAIVTARRKGAVTLANTSSNSAASLAAGTRVKVSAWVRSTQKKRQVVLAARGLSGSRVVATTTKRVRLGNKAWHSVSAVLRVPRRATSLRVHVRVPKLKRGRSMVVDNVAAQRITARPRAVSAASTATGRRIISANFNGLPTGQMKPADFIKTIGGNKKTKDYLEDTFIAADSRGSGKVLRTRLSKNTYHSSGGNNGISTFVPLGSASNRGCISYQIRFSPGFDWSLGGKLPGLEGVRSGVAPGTPSGGTRPGDKGWSGRMMWTTPKAYGESTSPNSALSYMYSAKQKSQYGDNHFWRRPFVAGRWHTVEQCYTMNTVGKSNGVLRGWFDGALVMNRTNYVYRTRANVGVNYLMWHIFRGGSDSRWASKKDGYVDIDNLVVTQG